MLESLRKLLMRTLGMGSKDSTGDHDSGSDESNSDFRAREYLKEVNEVLNESRKIAKDLGTVDHLLNAPIKLDEMIEGMEDALRLTVRKMPLSKSLDDNERDLRSLAGDPGDLIYRKVRIPKLGIMALVMYIDGLVDTRDLNEHVMEPLAKWQGPIPAQGESVARLFRESIVNVGEISEADTLHEVLDRVMLGDTAILFDGSEKAAIASIKGFEHRAVEAPVSEPSVRGPKESFIEKIRTNTALIRRRLRTPELTFETRVLGRLSKTPVTVGYVRGIANDKIVEEVRRRLARIDIDSVDSTNTIEELIVDAPYSPFPQAKATERPDVVAADLQEGRIVILVDGDPFALVVPSGFVEFIQSAEDYYQNYIASTLTRLLRYVFLNIALFLPSIWIAVTTFHQEMLPTPLLLTIAATRERVPFPAFIEAITLEIAFEVLREAGIRLPRAVGQAVSIVGALIIGEAAVRAGLVSPGLVIVVALTGIASFVIPRFPAAFSLRLLRFPLMFLSAALGLFGMMIGVLAILVHLCSLRTFGVPYLAPLAPTVPGDLKDAAMRAPWWLMRTRPRLVGYKHPTRAESGLRPGSAQGKD